MKTSQENSDLEQKRYKIVEELWTKEPAASQTGDVPSNYGIVDSSYEEGDNPNVCIMKVLWGSKNMNDPAIEENFEITFAPNSTKVISKEIYFGD